DPGKVDTGDHRQRRAQQARDVGDVERVNRGSVHLYEYLAWAVLRHGFRPNRQRLRRPTARLDYDCVHLRDACGGHSGLLRQFACLTRLRPCDVSAPRMLDAVPVGSGGHGVAWAASVSCCLVARVPIVAAATMARSTNPPAARNALWKPSVNA